MHAIVPLAAGFEEIEAVTIVDILRRADIRTTSVALDREKTVRGSRNILLLADEVWNEAAALSCDALVLPGGIEGTHRLAESRSVLDAVRQRVAERKLVGALCAAPLVLQKAGVLRSKKATCHPGCREEFTPGEYSSDPVVYDPPVVTSRGPGTALRFALKLVEILVGEKAAGQVAAGLVL